jgi:DNA-binding beta-propeller fold protein YncE
VRATAEDRPALNVIEQGGHCYAVEEGWGMNAASGLPDVTDVAVDSADNVYLFCRGDEPVRVFDRGGRMLRSFGQGLFVRPHGLHAGPDDTLYCIDEGSHSVLMLTPHGDVLGRIGGPDPAPFMSGQPFNRCTNVAIGPGDDIYVADGYGNARVHRYSRSGELLMSWGEPGVAPGQFNIVHGICCDRAGHIYIADRENHRIQIFDADGVWLDQWHNLHRPCGLVMADLDEPVFYVSELGPAMASNVNTPNLGPAISIIDHKGHHLARLGAPTAGVQPGAFMSPHGIAVDSHGDIYVAELTRTVWSRVYEGPPPAEVRTVVKLRRQ